MTQPHWTAIFLGSGGVVGGLVGAVTLVTNRLVEQKEESIKRLIRDNSDLKSQIDKERFNSGVIVKQFKDHILNIDAGRFSDADQLRIQQVFELIGKLDSFLEGFEDCEQAAIWLSNRKQEWAAEVTERTTKRYKRLFLLPRNKSSHFLENIEQYFDWAGVCLSKYGGRTTTVPIREFVKPLATTNPEPYLFAIKHLVDSMDYSDLRAMPRACLRTVFARSAKQLSSEFKLEYPRRSDLRAS